MLPQARLPLPAAPLSRELSERLAASGVSVAGLSAILEVPIALILVYLGAAVLQAMAARVPALVAAAHAMQRALLAAGRAVRAALDAVAGFCVRCAAAVE